MNGVFSIILKYFTDMSINQTSMEWGIINYDSKSEVFSEPIHSPLIYATGMGHEGVVSILATQAAGQR